MSGKEAETKNAPDADGRLTETGQRSHCPADCSTCSSGFVSNAMSDDTSDVNKTTRFKSKAKTKTEGHKTKTKTIGPITTYSLPTVSEIIFTAQYSITFAHYQLHNQIHTKVLNIKVL